MLCHNPFYRSTVGISKKNWELAVPFGCGQCLACRINQSRVWTHRILLENNACKSSAFVCLTYDDDNLPPGAILCKPDLQKYIKRIRKSHEPTKLRYFAVGEYGNYPYYRPHYHLAIFSDSLIDPNDINNSWHYGFTQIGDISKDSAAYIAGYCVKKLTARNDPYVDILSQVQPEFTTMSKQQGGIGLPAIKKLAEILKNNKFFDKKKILKQLSIGGKIYPLGRYLMNKLMDELGQEHREKGLQFYDYQQEIYKKYKHLIDTPGAFIAAQYNEQNSKRLSQIKKQKIFKRKRTL